jgi:hypothetical protein
VVARNAGGTASGGDVTFRTATAVAPRSISALVTPSTDHTAPFQYTVTGRITLPAGLSLTTGCHGPVTVRVSSGPTSVTAHTTINRACRYSVKIRLHGPKLARRGTARLSVRYTGTSVLKARSATLHTVHFGKLGT